MSDKTKEMKDFVIVVERQLEEIASLRKERDRLDGIIRQLVEARGTSDFTLDCWRCEGIDIYDWVDCDSGDEDSKDFKKILKRF